jgi:hypothetical protein
MRMLLAAVLLGLTVSNLPAAKPTLPGAEGFGASARGGSGGRILLVTRLDDDPRHPQRGMLRWALQQAGPRIVKFDLAGTIELQDQITVRDPYLTIDGSTAPGLGVCIRGGCLKISGSHDVVIREVRIRLGDETTLRKNKRLHLNRPHNSDGLDCITLEDSERILIDHCSLSWSCDEIIGITRCRSVTVQWCILSEPLANPKIHPYGDDHAFPLNASASTLSVHHCLFAHFVMRGPQFECNDLGKRDDYTVKMEAVNNVVFDYERSGARYSCGVERGQGQSKGRSFQFQFLNNLFLNKNATRPEIEAITKHGYADGVRVCLKGNETGNRSRTAVKAPVADAEHLLADDQARITSHLRSEPLFAAPVKVAMQSPSEAAALVLASAGCSQRDAADLRIIKDAQKMQSEKALSSQSKVGGWPKLR